MNSKNPKNKATDQGIDKFLEENKDLMDDLAQLEAIEEAAIRFAQNMGIPDCFYCGICGEKTLTSEELLHHILSEHKDKCPNANS